MGWVPAEIPRKIWSPGKFTLPNSKTCSCELCSWHPRCTEGLPPDRTCSSEIQAYKWWISLGIINHLQLLLPQKGGSFALPLPSHRLTPWRGCQRLAWFLIQLIRIQGAGTSPKFKKVPPSPPLPCSSYICPPLSKQQTFSWKQSHFLCQWLNKPQPIMDVSFPKNYHKNVWNPVKAVNDSKSPLGFPPPFLFHLFSLLWRAGELGMI